jgi:hypothetical protein
MNVLTFDTFGLIPIRDGSIRGTRGGLGPPQITRKRKMKAKKKKKELFFVNWSLPNFVLALGPSPN